MKRTKTSQSKRKGESYQGLVKKLLNDEDFEKLDGYLAT